MVGSSRGGVRRWMRQDEEGAEMNWTVGIDVEVDSRW